MVQWRKSKQGKSPQESPFLPELNDAPGGEDGGGSREAEREVPGVGRVPGACKSRWAI